MYLIRTACKTSKSYLEVNPFMTHSIPHENKPFIVGGIFDKHVQEWKVRLAPKMKAPVHITVSLWTFFLWMKTMFLQTEKNQ